MSLKLDGPLLVAGAGKMGGALLEGLIARGLPADQIVIQDPAPSPEIALFLQQHGIRTAATVASLPAPPSLILVAVKPQLMDQVFAPLAKLAGPKTVVLSIAAGKTLASFEHHLMPGTAVIRAMPNMPAQVGRGVTACVANAVATAEQKAMASLLLSAVGEVVWLEREDDMDAVTAVSGSGPAYVFLVAECLAEAGRKAGLSPRTRAVARSRDGRRGGGIAAPVGPRRGDAPAERDFAWRDHRCGASRADGSAGTSGSHDGRGGGCCAPQPRAIEIMLEDISR